MTTELWAWLLRTSYQVALLVLAILVLQRVFARWLSPRARYGLWLLVVLRLVVPIQWQVQGGSWSPGLAQEHPARTEVASEEPARLAPTSFLPRSKRNTEALEGKPEVEPASSVEERTQRYRSGASLVAGIQSAAARMPATGVIELSDPAADSGHPWALLLWIWVGGCLLALGRLALAERLFRRRLRSARPVRDAVVLRALSEASASLGLEHSIPCVETDALQSPAVHGLWNKRILLPTHVLESFSASELRLLFLHELSHVRRRDVELNLVLVLLSALFWFHPLVHLAFANLRGSQEALRDWEALASRASPSPRLYAGALLKCIERTHCEAEPARVVGFLLHGRSLKERILMITRFSTQRAQSRFLGALLALPLGWMAFTSAAPPSIDPHMAQDDDEQPRQIGGVTFTPAATASLKRIPVVSHQELPQWQQELQARLQQEISFEFNHTELDNVVQLFRTAKNLNIVVASGVDDYRSTALECHGTNLSIAEALTLICRQLGDEVGYCLVDEVIYIGHVDDLPETYVTHVYNVEELLGEDFIDDPEKIMDSLATLIRDSVDPEAWDRGVSNIRGWGVLLLISQTKAIHGEVEAFLNLLLNQGEHAPRSLSAREKTLKEQLTSQRVDVAYEDQFLADVADDLRQRYGLDLFVHPGLKHEVTVNLTLSNLRMRSVLGFLASASELTLWTHDGRVYLTERCEALSIEVYPIADLLQSYCEQTEMDLEGGFGGLEEIIRETVAPDSWEFWEGMWGWGELLVVNQSADVHAELKAFLGDLRAANR